MINKLIMRKYLFFIIILFTTMCSWSQSLKTEGKKIVDQQGNDFILRGMGLGGYMLMEGYMMQSSDVADTQWEFRSRLVDLMGEQKTDEFYDSWLTNHVTKADVDSLADWGFNSIRLPMHYNLFTLPIEEEPISGQNTWLNKGFVMVDSLLHWCQINNIYLILDLHAAPGGQGYNAAISDYDPSKPSLWESQENKDKTIALWGKLAERYKDEPWLGGYDLLNEVNWTLPGNTALKSLYVEITNAIRAVDTNHIIFIEGNGFANDFSGLTPPWDDNMAYSFHKYWSYNDQGSIQWVLDIRNQHNVPLWMGEAGENSNVWFHDAIKLFEDNNIGWSWWPMKRIETIVSPYSILFTQGYKDVLSYWRNQGPKPTVDEAYAAMMELASNSNSSNCIYQKDVPDTQIRQITTDETIPYSEHEIPGIVYMSDFDLGKVNKAYYDVDIANYSLSTGEFHAWNSGWVYRNDGVDIETNNDANNSNGYHIGFIAKGEWINYTVQITESGAYNANVRVASQSNGGKFHLAIDNEEVTTTHTVSSTGGWVNFDDLIITDILLNQGEHVLKIRFDNNNAFNVSSIEFVRTGNIEDISVIALNGYTGANEKSIEIAVNQTVLAESLNGSFDNFSLTVNGIEEEVNNVSAHESKERTIILTTENYLVYTDNIKVSYDGTIITSQSGKTLEPFTDLVIRNTLLSRHILPKKVQAEDFYFNSGLGVEETSDIGGGHNIGYTNPGDYADYLIFSEEDKYYQIHLRISALYGAGRVGYYIVDENLTETELCKVTIPVTGGWQSWETVTSSLFMPKGTHILRMRILSGEFNMNWFDFDMIDGVNEDLNLLNQPLVYPNPVSGNKLFVKINTLKQQFIPVDIFNLSGQLISSNVYLATNETMEIDITNITKGVFIFRIRTLENYFNHKLIRQ